MALAQSIYASHRTVNLSGLKPPLIRRLQSVRVEHVLLIAILVVGIALRLFRLNHQSLWLDEIGEGSVASTPFPRFFSEVRYGAGAAPLDYLAVKFMLALFGHGTTATRLWAFLCGSLVIFLTYRVGLEFFKSAAVGLIAAFMVSVSAFLIFYAQEARFYSLAALLGLLNLWAFNRAFTRDRRIDWIIFGLVVALGLYGHYFLAALVTTEGVFLVAYWLWLAARAHWARTTMRRAAGQVGRFLAASIAGIVVFVPWLLFAAGGTLNWGWPPPPPLDLARMHQIAVVLLALAPLNSSPSWNPVAWARTDVVLILAVLGLVVALVRARAQVLLLAITPPLMVVLAWRADQAAHYFWGERQGDRGAATPLPPRRVGRRLRGGASLARCRRPGTEPSVQQITGDRRRPDRRACRRVGRVQRRTDPESLCGNVECQRRLARCRHPHQDAGLSR